MMRLSALVLFLACTGVSGAEGARHASAAPAPGCGHTADAPSVAVEPALLLHLTGPHPAVDQLSPLGGSRAWYVESSPINFRGERYVKFGWPLSTRATAADQPSVRVVRIGEYDGVPVYAQESAATRPTQVWVQLDEVCHFQPYALASTAQ